MAPVTNMSARNRRFLGSELITSAKSGKPMKLQYAWTKNGAAKCPVFTKSRAEYIPKIVV